MLQISIFYLINWTFVAKTIQGRKLSKGRNSSEIFNRLMCDLELLKLLDFSFFEKNQMLIQYGFDHIVPGRFAFHLSLMVTITLFWCKFVSANLDMSIMYFFHFAFFFTFSFHFGMFPKKLQQHSWKPTTVSF